LVRLGIATDCRCAYLTVRALLDDTGRLAVSLRKCDRRIL
jgi:hypothetical protein